MLLPLGSTWATVVAVAVTPTPASGTTATTTIVAVILTEIRTGNVGTGTLIAEMTGTAIITVATAVTGGTAAARLREAGTRQTTVGAGATPGARLVVAARPVRVTTMLHPPALCRRPMVSLVGKELLATRVSISWNKRRGARVS